MAVTNKRGIFALLDVRERQSTGNWPVKTGIWLTPSPYYGPAPETGYFGGGGTVSTVDRIDYSNDTATASPKGPLSLARRGLGATGSASFGYFGGGGVPALVSTVDRIDYSNDTATASVRGPLSAANVYCRATGNIV